MTDPTNPMTEDDVLACDAILDCLSNPVTVGDAVNPARVVDREPWSGDPTHGPAAIVEAANGRRYSVVVTPLFD